MSEVETHIGSTIDVALLANRLGDAMAERNIVGSSDVLAAINATERDMTAQFGNASRELLAGQTNGFRDLVNTVNNVDNHAAIGFSTLGIQAEKISAAQALAAKDILLAGLKTQLEISAKMAECCCEIKEAIKTDGDETLELINANTTDALRAQLADAKSAVRDQAVVNAVLNQRGSITPGV